MHNASFHRSRIVEIVNVGLDVSAAPVSHLDDPDPSPIVAKGADRSGTGGRSSASSYYSRKSLDPPLVQPCADPTR